MTMTHSHRATATLAAIMLCGTAGAAEDGWQHYLTLYLVGASIDGTTGAGGVTADVDIGFDDILDNLEMGFMGAYRAERGRWAVVADLSYMKLEQKKDGLGSSGATRAKVEADQAIFELDGSYALSDRLSAYAGLRYWDLGVDLEIVGGGPLGETLAASGDETWTDPLVGLRYVVPLGERWQLIAKGDVGGFGVGSDFSWGTTAFAAWNLTEHAIMLLGVRWIDVDYEDGQFVWDVGEGGPLAAFTWRF